MTKESSKRRYKNLSLIYLFIDLIIIGLSFLIFIWIKPATIEFYFPNYIRPFLFFVFLWVSISFFFGKYHINSRYRLNDVYVILTFSNITILAIVTSLLFLFNRFGYSRMIVFGTFFISVFIEYFVSFISFSIANAKLIDEDIVSSYDSDLDTDELISGKQYKTVKDLEDVIVDESNNEAYKLMGKYLPKSEVYYNSNNDSIDLNAFLDSGANHLIDFYRINGIYGIGKYFFGLNRILSVNGFYVGRVETFNSRKDRVLERLPAPINRLDYFFDYLFTRVFPKLLFTKGIYFFFFRNRDRVLSKAEIFGRLYANGFEVVDEVMANNELFFVAKKRRRPYISKNPSYGLLITLNRHGKDGRLFKVYKLRTMHAYAEFLQEYVYKKHNLQEGGKFKNDFRITTGGKFLRRFWVDELPMLFNLIKGDVKLVGVRPLSPHYFNLYTESLRTKRIQYKPGLIPPFYVDLPKTFEEIMESELRYLNEYDKSHFLTDWKYFWKAIYNIFVKNVRGK